MTNIFEYLLIGNTRLHWAFNQNYSYKFSHTFINQSLPKNIDFKNLIWASVGKYPTNNLLKKNQVTLKDITLKKMPHFLGIDRALVCSAALKMIENKKNKNLLIVDLGTTVSITKIDHQGNFLGGQLFPGFTTQLKSMEQNTKNLICPNKLFIPNNKFEMSTMNAMLRGVYNSISGAIYSSYDSRKDILILCGGDASLIGNSLKKEIKNYIVEPNLVMYGMIFLNEKIDHL
tara:strand:+ start:798 stop:1490 length:693 start_codon:yes stop_codon:yes gene_type:complete